VKLFVLESTNVLLLELLVPLPCSNKVTLVMVLSPAIEVDVVLVVIYAGNSILIDYYYTITVVMLGYRYLPMKLFLHSMPRTYLQ
jgi:hypothetical protein